MADRHIKNPSLNEYSSYDTLSLRVRFVTDELRRLDGGLTMEDVDGEIDGLDEAVEDLCVETRNTRKLLTEGKK